MARLEIRPRTIRRHGARRDRRASKTARGRRSAFFVFAAFCAYGAVAAPAAAGPGEEPGERFEIRYEDLPPPPAERSRVVNFPDRLVDDRSRTPRVPAGFRVDVFAGELEHPRWLAVAPDGVILLAEPNAGRVTVLNDRDGDGIAEERKIFARGLVKPHGLAFVPGALLIADVKAVWRFDYELGGVAKGSRRPLTPPNALGPVGGHWTRNIAVDAAGEYVYVAIGSSSNVDEEPPPQATVQRFRLDGGERTTFASGLRNPVGIAFYPGTDDLYVVVNERDGLGDDLVPDYLTRIKDGDFFGWPYAYGPGVPDPDFGALRPDLVAATKRPDLPFAAHSAPIGLVFYVADQFPESFRGDAFVALRGSWNRSRPTGYKVVRVKFENGRPVGWYDNFVTGFWAEGETRAAVFGRPAGLAVAPDGSLLIADDFGGKVWRVSYGE